MVKVIKGRELELQFTYIVDRLSEANFVSNGFELPGGVEVVCSIAVGGYWVEVLAGVAESVDGDITGSVVGESVEKR